MLFEHLLGTFVIQLKAAEQVLSVARLFLKCEFIHITVKRLLSSS